MGDGHVAGAKKRAIAAGRTTLFVDESAFYLLPGAVRTLHSSCVVSFDVDRPRAIVRAYYGDAATTPKADLCCPVRPPAEDLRHIPKDVVDRFYGCGSPVAE